MFGLKRASKAITPSREQRIAIDARSRLEAVLAQGEAVYALSAHASDLRQRNHFGEAIGHSFLR